MSSQLQGRLDAEAADTRHVKHLFVVSNLGQVRNAAAVVKQLDLQDCHVIALWTEANPRLLRILLGLAAEFDLPATPLRLPKSPTDPVPWRINRVAGIMEQLVARYHAENLWLSNANSYYGYLAHSYCQSGASINLFEEGLGSYRTIDDPPYAQPPLHRRWDSTRRRARRALSVRRHPLHRRARRAGYILSKFAATTTAGAHLNALVTNGRDKWFRTHWSAFSQAVVVFPEVLDDRLVRAESVTKLALAPDARPPATCEARGQDDASARTMLISQRYGVETDIWGLAIGAELRSLGIRELIVKHHPRETPLQRSRFVEALRLTGLHVQSADAFDHLPAEELISMGLVDHVIGLTSSTLVYRPPAPHEVRYSSMAHGVLERLRRDYDVSDVELARFSSDLDIFRRVFDRVAVLAP